MKKFLRFEAEGEIKQGVLENNKVHVIEGDYFSSFNLSGQEYSFSDLRLLAPCRPDKIVAVGLNYFHHASEMEMDIPEEPIIFLKPSTSIIGHKDKIIYPSAVNTLHYEAELAAVIKKKCKNISPQEAEEYLLGLTCFNDVTARDLQHKDGQWTRAKSFDTFSPTGPCIVSGLDWSNLDISLLLNKEEKQSSSTDDMIFPLDTIISFISKIMTLLPGDIITTGTPAGVGEMNVGDVVEVRIEGIGSLVNYVTRPNTSEE